MRPTLVLNVVGLTRSLLNAGAPNLQRLAARGGVRPLVTVFPAVTCSVQTTLLTGLLPGEHGIVGNGWYFRELAEIMFWRQSNHLVLGERVWEAARRRDAGCTCANLFWWYNMHSSADIGVTPRPIYPADGRKIPDNYATPASLRDELNRKLGQFPLFHFWGPNTNITSSQWIAQAALHVYRSRKPALTLVYLPHLDYNLQRHGPAHPQIARDLTEIDQVCGELVEAWERDGARVLVLSEYGITPVDRPIHVNRVLRRAGLIQVREELGHDMLDAGASGAFAVADHQVAHIYVARSEAIAEVKTLIETLPGVERVLDAEGKREFGLDHPRSGELVAIADAHSWFTYYFWLDDARAPDYARTVDIHRKPGYDPVELFLDPRIRFPKLSTSWRLAKRALGLRTLMDVIPLNPDLVKGSHGRLTDREDDGPLAIVSEPDPSPPGPIRATEVKPLILDYLFGR
jgi:predicted AlkP superfamily pyrophosphatase or phosphodiesterase